MPWGRIDDMFYDGPKTVEAIRLGGLAAIGLHMLAISYCNRHLTDGFVSDGWVGRRTKLAEALVNARKQPNGPGMWERVDGGYQLHDYLEYNRSSKEITEKRRVDAERKRRGVRVESEGIPSPPARTRPSPGPTQIQKPSAARVIWHTDQFQVDPVLVERWTAAYPGVNVPLAITQAHSYFVANPERAKSNWQRTLVNWLKREQDRAPRPNGAVPEKIRPAILDLPPLTDEQAAENQRRAKEMVATAMGRLPGVVP